MRVLGIDQSTNKVGIAVMEKGILIHYELIHLEKLIKTDDRFLNKDYIDRITLLEEILINKVNEFEIDVVGFEDTVFKVSIGRDKDQHIQVFKKLTMVLGVVANALNKKQLAYEIIQPNVWREKLELGTLREEIKANTINYVNKKFKIGLKEYDEYSNSNDDDLADAVMIAYYLDRKVNNYL